MHLLQAPKQSAEDIANISGTCFKLNSLQLRALLSQYIPSERDGERPIPNELIDKVVQVAHSTADEVNIPVLVVSGNSCYIHPKMFPGDIWIKRGQSAFCLISRPIFHDSQIVTNLNMKQFFS